MIEAELKTHVHAPESVTRQLDGRATARVEVYRDTYYDRPDGSLGKAGQELRVRAVQGANSTRVLLTFKDAAVDQDSESKPEHQTIVEDASAAHAILRGLGYIEFIAFEKRCRNYESRCAAGACSPFSAACRSWMGHSWRWRRSSTRTR
ncbi:class IV adenylate cyclase [Streptomyces sp. NBC_01613]|uniref:class IV adenylate cyclase n=1 Tax=Streptomyces sp. NBC_01613 TaxID=2975896 RepID=UPI00386881C5